MESGEHLGKFYFACACAEALFRLTYEYVYYTARVAFISCDKKDKRRNQCRRDAAYRNYIVHEKIRIITSLYYIQYGGDSTAYERAANGCYYGGNYTAEPLLRAVFYFRKLCVVDGKLFIHEFHLRDHFCYVFVLLVYFTRDFFEFLNAMRIALRACAYFGNEPFVCYVITSVSVM